MKEQIEEDEETSDEQKKLEEVIFYNRVLPIVEYDCYYDPAFAFFKLFKL